MLSDGDLMQLGRRLEAAGASVIAGVPTAGGARQTRVDPVDLPLFLANVDAWTAKVCGVTPEQLAEYEANDRMPRCGADTKAGRRCRNVLASDSDPATFVELHGARCAVHQ